MQFSLYEPIDQELAAKLKQVGYSIDDVYANHKRELLVVISGQGVRGLAMFEKEAHDLANGRLTIQQILHRKHPSKDSRSES